MEIRYQPDQPVRITILSPKQSLQGQIVQMKNRAAILRLNEPVAQHALVRLEFEDSLVLGQVIACVPDGPTLLVSLQVVEAVATVSDLARLVSAVMQGGRSVSPEPAKAARAVV
jgi:hypothetical protein